MDNESTLQMAAAAQPLSPKQRRRVLYLLLRHGGWFVWRQALGVWLVGAGISLVLWWLDPVVSLLWDVILVGLAIWLLYFYKSPARATPPPCNG